MNTSTLFELHRASKRTCFLLYLLINSTISFTQEHKHHHQPRPLHRSSEINDIHLHIDIPERPANPEPHTPQDIKKLKIKTAAATAIITAFITGAVTLYIGISKCN